MSEWKPVVVLPNIEIQEPIESEHAALVGFDDGRVKSLAKAHPTFRFFLSKFTDAFGRKIKPSILIVPQDVPEAILRTDALSSFRDAVALSVIPYNCALQICYPRGHHVLWADYFSIYPWMISKTYDDMFCSTPAIRGIDDLKKFRGQSSPDLSRKTVNSSAIDKPLLTELLKRWRERYTTTDPAWLETALFRSLNMAFRAAEMPAGPEITFYDIGRSIALWVSAIEILAHPGPSTTLADPDPVRREINVLADSACKTKLSISRKKRTKCQIRASGYTNRHKVYALLDNKEVWDLDQSRIPSYPASDGRNKPRIHKCNGCWLYGELYEARNDFLHGNPVEMSRLNIEGSGRNLFNFAAPLYRMALTAFLPLIWKTPIPSIENAEAFGRHIAERMNFMEPQRTIEKSLLAAHEKPRF